MTLRTRQQRPVGTATAEELREALKHPLREEILWQLSEALGSATTVSEALGADYEKVAYHMRRLHALHCIEVVRRDKGKGGEEKFFRTTARPILDVTDAENLSQFRFESEGIGISRLIIRDLVSSIKAGTFDSNRDRAALRARHRFDEEGFHDVGELLLETLDRLQQIEGESVDRLARSGEEGMCVTTALLSIINPPDAPI